jgi:hypothetical protein
MSRDVSSCAIVQNGSALAQAPSLPPEWLSWVEVNLGRNPLCGLNLLLTLLGRGFDPLASLEATGDVPVEVDENSSSIFAVPICVLVASYRDPDCAPTLVDLFRQARHPERVRVAVLSQEEKEDKLVLPPELKPYQSQITIRRLKASTSKGVCWARHQGQKLLQLEPFSLQLDSHMRFELGWDLLLLATWLHCEDPRALLTTYPAGYTPGGAREDGIFHGMAAQLFDPNGILLMAGCPRFASDSKAPERPMAGAFISANFLFGPSSFVREVPYDPSLYFFGEEISLSVRLWTHGYNIYHPNRAVLYHDWDRARRATHFSDHKDWSSVDRCAKARVRALLGVPALEGDPLDVEFGPYGLGVRRSLDDYEKWSGVSFARQEIATSARKGIFPSPSRPTYGPSLRVVHADDSFMVVDDFLPEDKYRSLRDFLISADYKHINSSGTISRAWHLQDGFPLRSETSWIQMVANPPEPKPAWILPTGQPIDGFMQAIEAFQADSVPWIGQRGVAWDQFSATSWIYPPGTGLAMHTDGSNVYSGAYVYFLNDTWRSHWGGLLLVMDQVVNQHVATHGSSQDGLRWYRRRWLHENRLEELMLEAGGLGRVVFPKANRIVFLTNSAHHMVTRINEEAGDCVRLSLAGFFSVPRGK